MTTDTPSTPTPSSMEYTEEGGRIARSPEELLQILVDGPAVELPPHLSIIAPARRPGTLAFVLGVAGKQFLLFATDSPTDTAELLLTLTQLAQMTVPQEEPGSVDARIAQGRQAHARQVARPGEQVHQSGLIVPPGSAP